MDEGPVLSTDVRLALICYAPTSKNLKGNFETLKRHIVFALLVISYVFSKWLEPLFG